MSVNIPTHYAQQYSTNIQLLLQINGGMLTDCVTRGSYTGKQVSPVDQFGAVEMTPVTGRYLPKTRTDAAVGTSVCIDAIVEANGTDAFTIFVTKGGAGNGTTGTAAIGNFFQGSAL